MKELIIINIREDGFTTFKAIDDDGVEVKLSVHVPMEMITEEEILNFLAECWPEYDLAEKRRVKIPQQVLNSLKGRAVDVSTRVEAARQRRTLNQGGQSDGS